jgi:hypothetical protein
MTRRKDLNQKIVGLVPPGGGSTLAPSLIRITVGDLEVYCPKLRVTAATSSDHSCGFLFEIVQTPTWRRTQLCRVAH